MHINALRWHLAELGIVRAKGQAKMRDQLRHLVALVRDLRARLAEINRELTELAREHPAARRLTSSPVSTQ